MWINRNVFMWKTCNVVMLATNEKANIGDLAIIEGILKQTFSNTIKQELQHLYITSDEEIKEGDYIILFSNRRGYEIKQVKSIYIKDKTLECTDKELVMLEQSRKVIATTDSSLMYYSNNGRVGYNLPNLSQQFIQHYIEEYNKGNVITKVDVEYEDLTEQLQESVDNLRDNCLEDFDNEEESPYYHLLEQAIIELGNYIPKLKVNPDNTINIKPIKDSWSREEVIKLIEKFNDNIEYVYNYGEEALNEWIEENL